MTLAWRSETNSVLPGKWNNPFGMSMNEIIFIVEDAPEGGYSARALGESIFTEADDIKSLHEQVRDAVGCHFDQGSAPKIIRLHFTRDPVPIG